MRFRERSQENGAKAEKDQTEIARGLGRRIKEEIYKSGIKLAALGFQTGGRHHKSLVSLQWQDRYR